MRQSIEWCSWRYEARSPELGPLRETWRSRGRSKNTISFPPGISRHRTNQRPPPADFDILAQGAPEHLQSRLSALEDEACIRFGWPPRNALNQSWPRPGDRIANVGHSRARLGPRADTSCWRAGTSVFFLGAFYYHRQDASPGAHLTRAHCGTLDPLLFANLPRLSLAGVNHSGLITGRLTQFNGQVPASQRVATRAIGMRSVPSLLDL